MIGRKKKKNLSKKVDKEGIYLHTIKLYMTRTKFALYPIVKSEFFFVVCLVIILYFLFLPTCCGYDF